MGELVGVHGVAKHRLGRHLLLRDWAPALADGVERAAGRAVPVPDLDLAFYGDVFLPVGGTVSSGAKSGGGDDAELDGMDEAELAEVAEVLAESVSASDVAAAEAEVPKGYTRVPRPLQVLLRAVDRRFGAAAGVLYVGVLRQLRRYLTDPELKATVDARVEAAIVGRCRVLIGHSLGSLVAYEYLRQHPGHSVQLLLTLGSPLGLRMVRSRLTVEPLPVPAWVNVRDLRDPVTCAGPLHTWWPQIGPAGDRIVDNGPDAHAAEGYLARETTGAVLLQALPHLADG
ncbi:hypothetical protein [Dactylosporangium sp. NPDC048998]|uniref:hypothetical protein n=1 Tax=Dactylosporangium sp. NPDC048998 TaxID=3363976 RepID=UPI003719A9B4